MTEITELLQEKGIPCVPVNTPMGFTQDEHVQGRGFMAPVDHVGFGKTKQPAMPFVIDGERIPVGSVPLLDSWRSPSYISPVSGEKEREDPPTRGREQRGAPPTRGREQRELPRRREAKRVRPEHWQRSAGRYAHRELRSRACGSVRHDDLS